FGQYGLIDSDTSYVGGDRGFDMIVARWPVSSVAEINSIVSKIKAYELPAGFGSWRTRITLAADDEIHPNTTTNPPAVEAAHTQQADSLSVFYVPGYFINKKIYSWDYPFVNREKPEVNTAIVKEINDGTLILDYVGHGSPDLWAHEHIFTRTGDLPRLFNGNRLPLVYAASCAISFFDDPKREGMAEDFLAMNGGAISVIAATRLVFSLPNATFNEVVFDVLLNNYSLTMCEALYAAKLLRQYISPTIPVPNTNDRNYLYFGDPYLRLGTPRLNVMADSTIDSIRALEPVRITGRVTDDLGADYTSNGLLTINVYDSERDQTHRIGNTTSTFTYKITGPTMFRGTATITNGTFDFSFIPPLDIGYGGKGAKVSLYAALDTVDAIGVIDSISISGAVANTTDSSGPVIGITYSGKPLQAGGNVIQFGDILNVTLSDSSGLNLTEGIGHGITLETDNDAASLKNLTGLFQYNQDDFTSGALNYNLDSLEPGLHSFKIKAWDNANNSATLEFTAEIVTSSELAIQDLLNYPNPMSERTNFSFSLTQPVSQFSLEIFTLSGRKINSFDRYALAPAYYDDIVWD
ncbi:MAG: C25 family cysteine peptidase, partial [Candidatus Zixiibacteriota bacterium]